MLKSSLLKITNNVLEMNEKMINEHHIHKRIQLMTDEKGKLKETSTKKEDLITYGWGGSFSLQCNRLKDCIIKNKQIEVRKIKKPKLSGAY